MKRRRIKAYQVFEDSDFPLVCHRHESHNPCPLHSHEFHELVVVLSGKGTHITDNGDYQIEGGDVFVIRGNMRHGYANTEKMALVNIIYDPKRLNLPMTLLRDLPGYHVLFRIAPKMREYNQFHKPLRLSEEELAETAGMIWRLEQELNRKNPGYKFAACSWLMNLITFLSRCYSRVPSHAEKPFVKIGDVLSFIEKNYKEEITIKQLTKIAGMSESTLMRYFRKIMNRSPIDYIIRVRINKAAELLKSGNMRVTEAAYECGFSDGNYFSRQFKKILGRSPREFMKETAFS